jgi:hypothetical protein
MAMPKMKVTTTPALLNNPLDAAFVVTAQDFLEKHSATFSTAEVSEKLRDLKNEFALKIVENMETVAGFLEETRKNEVLGRMMIMISGRVDKRLLWMLENERTRYLKERAAYEAFLKEGVYEAWVKEELRESPQIEIPALKRPSSVSPSSKSPTTLETPEE